MTSLQRMFPVIMLVLFLFSGCSTVTNYNPAHISDVTIPEHELMQGKALVLTEKDDDAYVFVGSPTSFTGGGTTLSLELGKMTKQIADQVFDEYFTGGANTDDSVEDESQYVYVITPKVTSFNYEYNQLKNLGFAITPQVNMGLNVCLMNPDGTIIFEKDYTSDTVTGDSYMIALENPGEKINRVAHQVLYDLMIDAAEDVLAVANKNTEFR